MRALDVRHYLGPKPARGIYAVVYDKVCGNNNLPMLAIKNYLKTIIEEPCTPELVDQAKEIFNYIEEFEHNEKKTVHR